MMYRNSLAAVALALFVSAPILVGRGADKADTHDGKVVSVAESKLVMTGKDGKEHSHIVAADAKVTCDTCHGNVPQMEVMQKVKDISMAACIDCHKAHSARVSCDTCHEVQ